MKKYKVLSIDCNGAKFDCIFDSTKEINPYTLYRKWVEVTGTGVKRHRKKIVSYQDFASVISYLNCFAEKFYRWHM